MLSWTVGLRAVLPVTYSFSDSTAWLSPNNLTITGGGSNAQYTVTNSVPPIGNIMFTGLAAANTDWSVQVACYYSATADFSNGSAFLTLEALNPLDPTQNIQVGMNAVTTGLIMHFSDYSSGGANFTGTGTTPTTNLGLPVTVKIDYLYNGGAPYFTTSYSSTTLQSNTLASLGLTTSDMFAFSLTAGLGSTVAPMNILPGDDYFTGFQGINLTAGAIPEPSAYAALVGTAALGFALFRRRAARWKIGG